MLPVFKSQYSLGKSILTLEKAGVSSGTGPDSIIDICVENKVKDLFLVDDNMSGFLQAYTNAEESNLKLVFGLRLSVGPDREEKSEETRNNFCKFIIFARNAEGYKKLIKIYSDAAIKGFYYEPRSDYKTLKKLWDEDSLHLCVPFYDSFIFKNVIENHVCVPEISFTEPTFFVEDNSLPFDEVIKRKVIEYAEDKNKLVKVQSIYYKDKSDFMPYLTFRCINKRTTLDKPQLNHMCSNQFSFQSWKEQNGD
jgi:DNA polymerase-3 subunit alpha